MADEVTGFIRKAGPLARNPLGIVALFIALIYGFATLLLGTAAGSLESTERQPLVWFVVLFPILVLLCFYLLVTRHHGKLYAPDDYRDDQSFLQTLTPLQRELRLDEEIEATEAATETEQTRPRTTGETSSLSAASGRMAFEERREQYRIAERLALKKIAKETGLSFKEQVSFGEGRMGAFDAVAADGGDFLAVEVKIIRGAGFMPSFLVREILYRGVLAANLLGQRPGQNRLRLLLAFVLDGQASERREQMERMIRRQVADAPLPVELRFYELSVLRDEFGGPNA